MAVLTSTKRLKRYQELDALRGIAAIMVFIFHLAMGKQIQQYGFRFGVMGADLFFMISGFVIIMSISKISSSTEFIINRISRLYPTYWICVTITFLAQVLRNISFKELNNIHIFQYMINLTMFQYYFKTPNIDDSYWTLIIEMLFYISILFLYQIKKIKNIIPIGTITILCIICNDLIFEKIFVRLQRIHVHFPLINHFPLFFSGILFFQIITERKNSITKGICYVLLLLSFIAQILLFNDGGKSNGFVSQSEYAYVLLVFFLVFILFVNKKLDFIINKTTLFLGKISFPLYLIHQYLSREIFLPLLQNYFHLNFWIASLLTIPIIIAGASIISRYIEVPYGKRMKILLQSKFLPLQSL